MITLGTSAVLWFYKFKLNAMEQKKKKVKPIIPLINCGTGLSVGTEEKQYKYNRNGTGKYKIYVQIRLQPSIVKYKPNSSSAWTVHWCWGNHIGQGIYFSAKYRTRLIVVAWH